MATPTMASVHGQGLETGKWLLFATDFTTLATLLGTVTQESTAIAAARLPAEHLAYAHPVRGSGASSPDGPLPASSPLAQS